MQIDYSNQEMVFRKEVVDFFSRGVAAELRQKLAVHEELSKEDRTRWHKALYEKGWAAINWPEDYGGTGWSSVQKHIFMEEIYGAGLPPLSPFGIAMVAPIILAYGSEEQKERFLPGILSGDTWWCQGYSEPGAGSDLAALKTRALREGDHYIVDGMKAWNTEGHFADWIFCLVRTNSEVPKQRGISFLLIDMKSPGVTVRPVITLDGVHEINEVFFDQVRVPLANRIGEENLGWTYAKALLQHERTGIAGVGWCVHKLNQLKAFVDDQEGYEPGEMSSLKRKLARVEIELEALNMTDLRVLAGVKTGGAPGPESSILKVRGTEIQQRITELFVEAAAYAGIPYAVPATEHPGHFMVAERRSQEALAETCRYLNFRKATIFGGSTEIQKNIIAKAVLGL